MSNAAPVPPATPSQPGPSVFSALDLQLARFLTRRSGLSGKEAETFEALLRELSAAMGAGHSCLRVDRATQELLAKTRLASTTIETPLVVFANRLYLQRYYLYESRLAEQLAARAAARFPFPQAAQETLDACFARDDDEFQRQAAELAITRSLALISGGPGTGKTSTVTRILGLLLSVPGPTPRIALAAPTGKAAMRLKESIAANLATSNLPQSVKDRIPTSASTIHRLLGARHHSVFFQHHHQNPLPWDVVVVDEASMVDLALMSKLVDALKPHSRLILLGDRDQLASVESGAVLADCIAALPDNTVILQKSHRSIQEINSFAGRVNQGEGQSAWSQISSDETTRPAAGQKFALQLLQPSVVDCMMERYHPYLEQASQFGQGVRETADLRQLFKTLNSFRVLCATRLGPDGVEPLNAEVERALAATGWPCHPGSWYPGRPVILQRNDYSLHLFNGDIGICLPSPEDPQKFQVWFEQSDGDFACFHPGRLPACETVFAMTIHKSQGSEFDEILIVLPRKDTPLLTRELVYTAVTRARNKVLLHSSAEIFQVAVSRTISRTSGLHEMLKAGLNPFCTQVETEKMSQW